MNCFVPFWRTFFLLSFLSLCICANAEERIVISTGEIPPRYSSELKYNGTMLRVVREAFALEGVDVVYKFYPWKRAMEVAKQGEVDASALWVYKAERDKEFHHSDPVYVGNWYFFHLKGLSFEWSEFEDLRGLKVGAIRGYTYGDDFNNAIKIGLIDVQWLNSEEQLLKALETGRVDIVPGQPDTAFFHLNRLFGEKEIDRFSYHAKAFFRFDLHLLLSKKLENSERLVELFNSGLLKLKKTGLLEVFLFDDAQKGIYVPKVEENNSNKIIDIITIEIPGLHQVDTNGKYDKILKSIKDYQSNLKSYPAARAFKIFAESANACISPANESTEFYEWEDKVYMSQPMGNAKIYLFSPAGEPIVNLSSELKGKKIGIRRGMVYGTSIEDQGFDFEIANRLEYNIKKLDEGRIDYMIAYVPDAYVAFKKLGKEPYPHDKDMPIAVHQDKVVCKGRVGDFINKINKAIELDKNQDLYRQNDQEKIMRGQSLYSFSLIFNDEADSLCN